MSAWLGLSLGLGAILIGNWIEGGVIGSLIQGPAAFIVFGGTLGAVILSSSWHQVLQGFSLMRRSFQKPEELQKHLFEENLQILLDCARLARRETILSIEGKISSMKHPFLQSVMKSVVDGIDPLQIASIHNTIIHLEGEKKLAAAKIWSEAGGYAPTIGILGAVLGLIQVMSHLSETSKLGSGIATAFVATVYGVGSANLLFLPLAQRIRRMIGHDMKVYEMILEGGLAIQSGLSPGLVELKLQSFSLHTTQNSSSTPGSRGSTGSIGSAGATNSIGLVTPMGSMRKEGTSQ